jgi:pyrrolidone-carboxylate peptidase
MKLVLIFLLLSSPILAQAKRKIILSYFKAFGGSSANHTGDVARAAKVRMEKENKDIEVVLCPLEEESREGMSVTFHSVRKDVPLVTGTLGSLSGKSAFESLKSCFDQNPDSQQVISLGEGSCQVQVEGIARNSMSTGMSESMRDQGGNMIATREEILLGGEKLLKTDEVNTIALCIEQNTKTNPGLLYSTDAGVYVCNNLTYNFQSFINYNKLPISYSFVHVPPHHDRADMCGDLNEYQEDPKVPMTNEVLTSGVAKTVSSFILQKDNVLQSIASTKDYKKQYVAICEDKAPAVVEDMVDYSEKAFQKLKETEKEKLLEEPLIRACIQRNRELQKNARVESFF